jgi:hypothetical protein
VRRAKEFVEQQKLGTDSIDNFMILALRVDRIFTVDEGRLSVEQHILHSDSGGLLEALQRCFSDRIPFSQARFAWYVGPGKDWFCKGP